MKNLLCPILLIASLYTSTANAEITTEKEAEKFLESYCIALINEIQIASQKQEALAKKEQWEEFFEQGVWIAGVADVFSKLCKD